MKIPDWHGLLVLDPRVLSDEQRSSLLEAWAPLASRSPGAAVDALAEPERVAFNHLYLAAVLGDNDSEDMCLHIERELRAAVAERHARTDSVAEAKLDKTPSRRATASVDAYASRVAAKIDSFPDPRRLLGDEVVTIPVIVAPVGAGRITVGQDLFSFNDVFVGDVPVATAQDPAGAQFIRGVLLHDPGLAEVHVPLQPDLQQIIIQWTLDCSGWQVRFKEALAEVLTGISDERLRTEIHERALVLLHAS